MLNSDKKADFHHNLDLNPPAQKTKRALFLITTLLLVIFTGIALKILLSKQPKEEVLQFETVPVKRGDLTMTVTATGKLEPVTQVDIGIEVSGTVAEIKADFNDHVSAGQVLATLDTRIFVARVKQSQGVLDQAQAKLADAQATISEKAQVLAFMQQARQLSGGQLPAKQDIVSAEANLKRAQALKNQVLGAISQAEGQLKLDETNLIKSSIKTPIDGIVLDRKIENGQTVAASLQTPVMFTIAKNLTEMELHVDVDEADVSKIKLNQTATFTVDAYPDKNFPAKISEIRYAPQTVNGVVTYETVLSVNNADLFLRPGMTATADMVVNKAQNVLLVPSAALRFSPSDAEESKKKEPSFLDKLFPRNMGSSNKPKKAGEKKPTQKKEPQIWVLHNHQPHAIEVKLGLTDGDMNEVSAPHLKQGMPVIIDTVSPTK